jgi:riboflavin kinase/FMN adenylyltransferase
MRIMSPIDPIRLGYDQAPPAACRGGAVAVGNFDGVHLGHAHLVRSLREQARPAVVVSFDPHPLCLLSPERFQPLLTTPEDRAEFLHGCGADHVVLLKTTPELLRLSAAEFFERILRRGFQPQAIVEGFNFQFGRDRAGNLETLAELCRPAGIRLTVVPPLELDGAPVSSSRVRNALLAGDADEAARLMGRCYRLQGVVGGGQRRGRLLGFPTANLEKIETLLPADGVYAVRVKWDETAWAGAANVGANPTFGENARKLEVHVLDFSGDLYGKRLTVEFVRRLRGTQPFAGAEALKAQLQKDIEQARLIVGGLATCPAKT